MRKPEIQKRTILEMKVLRYLYSVDQENTEMEPRVSVFSRGMNYRDFLIGFPLKKPIFFFSNKLLISNLPIAIQNIKRIQVYKLNCIIRYIFRKILIAGKVGTIGI